jgi:transcriptional regulator with XRE-family HTH domain
MERITNMNNDGIFPTGEASYDLEYSREGAMVDAAELIAQALETSRISQAGLARKLRISRSEVTARLKGERNITVRKLAETLHALGGQLVLSDAGQAPQTRQREWKLAPEPVAQTVVRQEPWQLEETPHER